MTPSGYSYYRRRFLNHPGREAGAYVLAGVYEASRFNYLHIADCRRVVCLEFDSTSPRAHRNCLHKLDVLIQTLTEFRAALIDARAAQLRR